MVFLKSMQVKTMESHTEQVKTYMDIKSMKEGNGASIGSQFLGGGTVHQRSLRTLLSPARIHICRVQLQFLQLLCRRTPDNATN